MEQASTADVASAIGPRPYGWYGSAPADVPALRLNRHEVKRQVRLIKDGGLLGRGATALVFKCVWPDRFGPSRLLAAKVGQGGFCTGCVRFRALGLYVCTDQQ
jgi:hypothetical protein